MLKTLIKFLSCFLLSSGLMAQEYKKDWAQGKLSWNDFSESKRDNGISEFRYFLGYNTGKQVFGDTSLKRTIAHGYMDKKQSWVNPDFRSDQNLRYNQVIFDLVEIHKRRLQHALDRINSQREVERTFNLIYNECNTEIDKFQRQSMDGNDLNSLILWEQKTARELANYPDEKIPEFETRNFGYALHAGFGSGFFTGSLGKHFTSPFNFQYGFDFAFKRSILFLNGTLAWGKAKSDFQNWDKGQQVTTAILNFSFGYALIDNTKIKLSPFVGWGVIELAGENKEDKENGLRITDHNLIFGINADYKLFTRLKLIPNAYSGIKEKVETSIRARLYITRANYYEDLNGYSINLTFGICGFGNFIRLKQTSL